MIGTKKVAGIIAEYNPFHAGHQYHIEETRRITGAEYIVVVMSGDFVQRGEPAMVDKYLRARSALISGADLVIELPVVYATGSAQYFAFGAVSLLKKLGCVDYLSFGSEWSSIESLEVIADVLEDEPETYQKKLSQNMADGMNFPRARAEALTDYFNENSQKKIENLEELLSRPNHILALEYIHAIRTLNATMIPVAIPRKESDYHETELKNSYSSATAIREALQNHTEQKKIMQTMAGGAKEMIEAYQNGETVCWDDLQHFFNYTYLYHDKNLEQYFGVDHDLARRIQNHYKIGMNFDEMIESLHMKSKTDTSLKRALLHVVLRIEETPYLQNSKKIKTPYIRVLGMCRNAGALVKKIREENGDVFIQKPVLGLKAMEQNEQGKWLYQNDLFAANLYEQICAMKCHRYAKDELEQQQIIIERE